MTVYIMLGILLLVCLLLAAGAYTPSSGQKNNQLPRFKSQLDEEDGPET